MYSKGLGDGLAILMTLGLVFALLIITAIPPVLIYALLWLGEARFNIEPFNGWIIAQGVWFVVISVLFLKNR